VTPETEIRPAVEADVPALVELLAGPGVKRWWGDNPAEEILEMVPTAFVVLSDDLLIGWLQYEEKTWFQGPSVDFDIAIADRFQGRGHGPEALRLAAAHFATAGHHRFTISPAVANEAAISAYKKAGFEPVGVLSQSSRVYRDDAFEDDLLMELIIPPPGT
jgi:aminoglycoside 6'-N-acetyltransferase